MSSDSPHSLPKPLVIRDEIHGDMAFDPALRFVIDHPAFQRLRRIKQLGLAEFVFPCATHTRFQHSLGAAYLAGKYLESMLQAWLTSPFRFEGQCEKTRFHSVRTLVCIESVMDHEPSQRFWKRVITLAGLLHDVGHGPWSHTFENLGLKQDFSASTRPLEGVVQEHYKKLQKDKEPLHHEDLSLLYMAQIFRDLAGSGAWPDWELYFLPVAMLVHRKLTTGPLQKQLENELSEQLKKAQIRGGVDFHTLLRPMISGTFDCDRIDYIQRDGRNCGVFIAGIEWRRIVNKLLPCLAEHDGNSGEPRDVVLVSNIKNQHVIDDFVFTLFQMYAQVYLHPKIVGLEEVIRELIARNSSSKPSMVIDLKTHQALSDEKFREILTDECGIRDVDKFLFREKGSEFEVARYPAGSKLEGELKKRGFTLVENLERPLMKDSVGVFLYSSLSDGGVDEPLVRPWSDISPIAQQFFSLQYAPNIWIRNPLA